METESPLVKSDAPLGKMIPAESHFGYSEYINNKLSVKVVLIEEINGKEQKRDILIEKEVVVEEMKGKTTATEAAQNKVRDFIGKATMEEALTVIESWVNEYGTEDVRNTLILLKAEW